MSPATRCGPPRKLSGAGWIVEVLPQLEEQALYDQFKPYLDKPWYVLKQGMNANVPELRQAVAIAAAGVDVPVERVSRASAGSVPV